MVRDVGESDLSISGKKKKTKSASVCSHQRFVFLYSDEKKGYSVIVRERLNIHIFFPELSTSGGKSDG